MDSNNQYLQSPNEEAYNNKTCLQQVSRPVEQIFGVLQSLGGILGRGVWKVVKPFVGIKIILHELFTPKHHQIAFGSILLNP